MNRRKTIFLIPNVLISRTLHVSKCHLDRDRTCSNFYYKLCQGQGPASPSLPFIRLVVPISDMRGEHLLVSFPPDTEINAASILSFVHRFHDNDTTLEIDMLSQPLPIPVPDQSRSAPALTAKTVLSTIRKDKRDGLDVVILYYRSNLKRDRKLSKSFIRLASRFLKKHKDKANVRFYRLDVDRNAALEYRQKRKALPAVSLFRNDFVLQRFVSLEKITKFRNLQLFLNDRLERDYTKFFADFEA